jgi:hypothetical protein
MANVLCRAVANAVYNNVVSSQLQLLPFTDAQRTALLTSALDTLETLSSSEKRMATEVLADGLRKVYIMFTVIAGTTLVCGFFIQVRPDLSWTTTTGSLFPSPVLSLCDSVQTSTSSLLHWTQYCC